MEQLLINFSYCCNWTCLSNFTEFAAWIILCEVLSFKVMLSAAAEECSLTRLAADSLLRSADDKTVTWPRDAAMKALMI